MAKMPKSIVVDVVEGPALTALRSQYIGRVERLEQALRRLLKREGHRSPCAVAEECFVCGAQAVLDESVDLARLLEAVEAGPGPLAGGGSMSSDRRIVYIDRNAIHRGKDESCIIVADDLSGLVDQAERFRELALACACGCVVAEFKVRPRPPEGEADIRVWIEAEADGLVGVLDE